MMDYELLDRDNAAEFLNCSTRTLARLTEIPRVKIGARRIVYRKADLIAYAEGRAVVPAAA